jgi:choloylglycine hydrolase
MPSKFHILTLLLLAIHGIGSACTTFVMKDGQGRVLFGKNFDFPAGQGHIHINHRDVAKTSFVRPPERPFSWVAKYGSVTFNQAGKEFPYGRINEKGLVIEQMWLQEAGYPEPDHRFGLSELQWIQYQLDHAASVQEVIDSDSTIRISQMATSYLHFLVSDASGNAAAIEYIDGVMVVHWGADLPYPVLTNCTYRHSLGYKSSIDRNDTVSYNAWTKNSSGRFVNVVERLDAYKDTSDVVDHAFQILEAVAQPGNTQWSIVYDIGKMHIHYASAINPIRQTIDVNLIDFSCREERPYTSVSADFTGPESFRALSLAANLELIESVINSVDFLKNTVPPEYRQASAAYFESTTCIDR